MSSCESIVCAAGGCCTMSTGKPACECHSEKYGNPYKRCCGINFN